MVPTLDVGQRVLTNRLVDHPSLGDIVVFHPPHGADYENPVCGNPNQGNGTHAGVRRAHAAGVEPDVHQARRRRSRRHDLDPRRPRLPQRRAGEGLVHRPVQPGHSCLQFPDTDQDSARRVLHDGGQPSGLGGQPILGPRPGQVDHRCRFLHLLAAGPDRVPLAARTAGASRHPAPPGGCSGSTGRSARGSSPAPTRPAGAAWPGRWSPPPCCSTSSGSVRARCARSAP